ncbi:GGDEF domain-containing protein [Halarcobacter anaerophilus]|uniref:GGDEF domain-containing protein n=1 Tax=Halarcobacter anaerophilus TaxID=877500 RepID=A0A4Q0Y0H4_9BACT|nr:GGDEF domain-containing protein [Halarcobacter anaerophilus]QDF28880.1 diguanylate cyclase [Halarcobacter anaerophilus]RXJ63520.1 GGDEF domain-containing protein [Halarcobacter anaerophilus]
MKNSILELVKKSSHDEEAYKALEKIYQLYDQLQYSSNIKQMAEDIYVWLHTNFNIDNVTFALFDIERNNRENIFVEGDEFYLDDDMSFFFIINTHTALNAIVSFCANSKEQHEEISKQYNIIEAALFQISPILQNGIIKKNFIETLSLDSVTKVYNRHYLIENLNKQMNLSKKEYNSVYFLMIGIDHFKAVIDEFDHDIADQVLIELAKIIHTNISEFDMVARLSGDEFLISMLSSNSEEEIRKIAQNIIDDFSKVEVIVSEDGQTLKKTVCVGIDVFDTHDKNDSIDKTIKNADIALYEAKNRGRSQLFNYKDLKVEDTIELF